MANVGYATLQIIPSVRGIAGEIRQQLAPAAGEGERAGGETGRGFGEGFKHLLEAAGVMTAVEKITEGITEAFGSAIEQSGMPGRLKAQLGTTAPIAAQYGNVAGQLYAGGISDSVEDAAETIRSVASAGLLPPGATQAQIKTISTQFSDFTSTFEQDSALTAQAVNAMVKNGLAKDGPAALDLLTTGFQKFGPRAEDLVETMQEYPVQLRKLGLDGKTTLGLLGQALQGGARDTDIAADALKEFSIRSIDGSATSIAGYKGLGLSAKDMAAQIVKGGSSASAGLQTVLDRLRGIKDPVKQSQLAVDLFGTQAEDLGKSLYNLDPSKAVKSIGDVGGASKRLGTDLRDNAGARLTAFSRGLKQGLVQVIGGQVLPRLLALGTTVSAKVGPPLTKIAGVLSRDVGPAMDQTGRFITGTLVPGLVAAASWTQRNATTLGIVGGVITALLLPLLITLAVSYATAGVAAVASGASQVASWISTGATAVAVAALEVAASYATVAGWIASGAAALAGGARVVAGWALSAAAALAGAASTAIAVTGVVAGWVVMGVQSLIRAAQMAAAWVIALGPIAWVTIAIVAIAALIILKWDTIKSWTISVWNAVWGFIKNVAGYILGLFMKWTLYGVIIGHWSQIKSGTVAVWNATWSFIKGIPGQVVNLFLRWTLYGVIITHWSKIKTGTISKAGEMLTWVGGLPGRIVSAVGDLGGLLKSAGADIITGLWSGISSMGDWLAGKIGALVKDKIPGPIRKVLDMHSPSRVMAELGRFAGLGLVQGLTGTASQVAAASKKVADSVRKAFAEATASQIVADRKALLKLGKGKGDQVRAAALRRDIASQTRIAHAGAGLARIVAADNTRLATLAKQRDNVAGKLKAAQDKLAGLQKSWTDLRDQIAGSITQAAGITREMPDGTATTAATILARLMGDVKAAQLFTAQLATLRKKGLSAGLIDQIGSAGVEGGEATAAALAAATPAQIKAINQQQAALGRAATAAGGVAADAMYGSGIRAAQGLVDGLKKQQGAIEAQMVRIAKSMQKAIQSELKIHSPSRVMAAIGSFVGRGLVVGVDGERGRVDAAMRRLVAVPPAPQLSAAGARGTAAGTRGGRPINITMNAANQSLAEQRADLIRHMAVVA